MLSIRLNILDTLEDTANNTNISFLHSSSITEVLMEICDELQRYSEQIAFSITGFEKDWSLLDIETDLCMLMEDLPDLVNFINNSDIEEYQFGFPEQHLQRILTIKRFDGSFKIVCSDWLAKSSEQSVEIIPEQDLRQLLHKLVYDVSIVIKKICPSAFSNSFFQDWLIKVKIDYLELTCLC